MTTLSPADQTWYSIHRPILFGADQPFYPQGYVAANDDGNGKVVFTRANFIIYPFATFSKQFWVDSGPYAGYHTVIKYDSLTEEIFTDSNYIGPDPIAPAIVRSFYQVVPFGYEILYGYPSQTNSIIIRAFHKFDGTAFVDIGSVLKNALQISPPVAGFDLSMFTYFRINYVALGEFKDLLDSIFVNINTFTGWNYLSEIYYGLNASVPHSILQSLIAQNKYIAEYDPIFAANCCNTLTKIINGQAFNYIVCPEGSGGIGQMQIEETFVVN